MEKINVGVIGCGLIAKVRHIPALKRMSSRVNLNAICDLNEEIVNATASQFGISKAYTDVSQMLQQENLDLIDICVPPQAHTAVALEAIEQGCSVTMEKPMALKVSDCDEMIAAARRNNVKLCVGHNNIFHPPFLKAKEIVARNEIGDVNGMRIFLSTPKWDMIDLKDHWYHRLPGGVLGETGPHMAYMTMEFLNNIQNVEIFAKNNLKYSWAPYDEFNIILEGETGVCSTKLSYSTNYWAAEIDVLGTEAFLRIDLEHMNVVKYQLKQQENLALGRSTIGTSSQMMGSLTSNTVKAATGNYKLGTDLVIEKVVDSILNDSPPPVTGEDGREAVRIMEMVVNKYNTKYF